ncbi:flavodoxin family protein [Methanoregula formicica]|uniref:Multimeric flavodoxin WrbA n=1 Tax=Methanoregula formicica (strain DSM 22288 / NBRC 105244 / SMSP) TaxID=593750 RepID=L0HD48_METFS|nr:flavodoxin family protein [Methanoregula formicica]AGB01691.1 multimeric flavodoxin WrbA [Methanoregula formicica SMSP]
MEPVRERLRETPVKSGAADYLLTLDREDYSALYPRMVRYVLAVSDGERRLASFRTNTFEYSPLSPLAAESVALEKAGEWEKELAADPSRILREFREREPKPAKQPSADLVLLQGSPRPDGNCAILAGWATDAARDRGRTAEVIYPHDLDIHCCIGCYQCYNTGTCVFDDDMNGIIDAVRGARLIIVCSPVYTNTVTAGLKLVIDRMQAYHAERTLFGGKDGQHGLLFSVAGRKGGGNFTCITKVVTAFFKNCGIEPAGEILIDSVDAVKDIREIAGKREEVSGLVRRYL